METIYLQAPWFRQLLIRRILMDQLSYQGDDTVTEIMVSDQRRLEMNSPGESVFRS